MPRAFSDWLEGPRKFAVAGVALLLVGLIVYLLFSGGTDPVDPVIRPVRKALRDGDVAALKAFVADANPKISAEAMFCLQQLQKGGEAASVIRERLNNSNPQVKASALMNLGMMKQADDVALIAGATTDADAGVRRAACVGLGYSGSPEAIEPLAKVLEKDKEEPVWSAAMTALKQVTGVANQLKSGATPEARRAMANQYRAQIPLARTMYEKAKALQQQQQPK